MFDVPAMSPASFQADSNYIVVSPTIPNIWLRIEQLAEE